MLKNVDQSVQQCINVQERTFWDELDSILSLASLPQTLPN